MGSCNFIQGFTDSSKNELAVRDKTTYLESLIVFTI